MTDLTAKLRKEIMSYSQVTLRDRLAMAAPSDLCRVRVQKDAEELAGRAMPSDIKGQVKWNADVEAYLRYAYADAMLAARSAKGEK